MSLVALIHTVPTVYSTFGARIIDAMPDTKVINTVDEFLASDPAQKGKFTPVNKARLFSLVKTAEATDADVILTTCSTLSPVIEQIREFVTTPIITIDGYMLEMAVAKGKRIAILATAESTLGPTKSKLMFEADKLKKEISVTEFLCPEAYTAIKACDQKMHDRIVLDRVKDIHDQDVIILAQASMAHLEKHVSDLTGKLVLSSPRLCIQELAMVFEKLSMN